MTALTHHWPLALAAAAVGLSLGFAFVAVCYLAVPLRLRLTADPVDTNTATVRRDLGRVRRLGDAAAVSEEHGLAGAGELREEAELRTLLLRLAL